MTTLYDLSGRRGAATNGHNTAHHFVSMQGRPDRGLSAETIEIELLLDQEARIAKKKKFKTALVAT